MSSASKGKAENRPDLRDIFEASYDSVFVTDCDGVVLMANPACAKLLATPLESLIGCKVTDLVSQGVYDKSIALRAAREKRMITGIIKTKAGLTLMSTSVPLMDEHGVVKFVISHSRKKELVDQFLAVIEQDRIDLERQQRELDYLRGRDLGREQLICRSSAMQQVVGKAEAVAKVSSPVLLLGESGVGKDVLARYIHRNSNRCNGPFIAVNCAAIPENLIESELFGYEKGAFSGANPKGKLGLVELADKGTLFLDEVAEIPLMLQAKLLRVLESCEIRRVGSTYLRKIDFRLIAATNRDLKLLVSQGKFREDLFYRLTVFPIRIPPLRERTEDIEPLIETFMEEFCIKFGAVKRISRDAIASALSYSWPGNVRELRNTVERLFISTPGDVIECRRKKNISSTPETTSEPQALAEKSKWEGSLKDVLQKVEESYIRQVIQECQGRVGRAAQKLGIHRTALWRKIQEYKVNGKM